MKDRILKIITDALAKAGEKFDSDGESVWVDEILIEEVES